MHKRPGGRRRQSGDYDRSGQDRCHRSGRRPAVIEHQRPRPERQPQVMENHAELACRVVDPRDGHAVARTGTMRREYQQRGRRAPGCRQSHVHPPPPAPRLAERSGQECPIVQENDQGNRYGHFLAACRKKACQYSPDRPAARMRRRAATNGRVERPETEQPHHRLASLDDVGHRLGLQRVQAPDERHGQRQRRRCRSKTFPEAGQQERSANDSKKAESGQQVNRQIREVIMESVQAAGRIVDRQRKVHHRPTVQERPIGVFDDEDIADRPKMADRIVLNDVVDVIEEQSAVKTVGIGNRRRQHDQPCRRHDRPPG